MKLLNFKNAKFQTKIIIIITLSFFVSIIFAGFYAAYSFKKAAVESASQTIRLVSENYAEKIQGILTNSIDHTELATTGLTMLIDSKEKKINLTKSSAFLKTNRILKKVILAEYYVSSDSYIKSDSLLKSNSTREYQEFIYTRKGTVHSASVNSFVSEKFPIPLDVKLNHRTILQTPDFIQIAGEKHFVYAVITPIIYQEKYMGYVRLFYLDSKIKETINKPIHYTGYIKFILASDDNRFITVSNKDFLKGNNINSVKRAETKIYNTAIQNLSTELYKDEVIGFSQIKTDISDKPWVLVSYISHKKIIPKLISTINTSIILASALMLLGLFLTILYILTFFKRLYNTIDKVKKTSEGQMEIYKEEYKEEELSDLTKAVNKIIQRRNEIIKISKSIAEGIYSKSISARSSKDEIANALNTVNIKLQEIETTNKKQQKENDIRNWQRKGQITAAEIQRTSNNETEELSFNLIRSIVRYTEAQLGAIYVKRKDVHSDKKFMEITGSYAYDKKRNVNIRFNIGEGIIGTCAREEKKTYIENIPDNYLTIGSGLGSSKPGFIAIFPIFSQEKTVAVLEIGFINKPDDYKINFIEQLSDNIGAWLSATENLKESENLLRLSQEKTHKLSEAEAELNSILKAVNHTIYTIQYAPDGKFIDANELYLNKIGYQKQELEGTNVLDLVKDKKEELENIIDRVMKGDLIEQKVVRYTKTGEPIKMRASYSPFYNSEGEITSIIFFGFEN